VLVAKTILELKSLLSEHYGKSSLGLVPTMGALHQGHISLVKKALEENTITVLSIFVNPTQFDNHSDLDKYPRTLESDISLLKEVSKEIIVFAPSANEIYPEGEYSNSYNFDGLEKVMEGAFRDGHFDGVGTIVEKLLKIVAPDRAYFGEKDFQQLQIIRKMVELKKIPVEIVGCPIVREENGLARSSRNERLSTTMRKEASFIYATLKEGKKMFGMKSAESVLKWVKKKFKDNSKLKLEYFVIAESDTLRSIKTKRPNRSYRAFVAAYADDVRLIDNIALN